MSKSEQGSPFDLERLRELIEMMEQHGVTEVNLRRGDERWQLRRGPQEVMQMVPASSAPAPPPPPPPTPAKPETPSASPAASEDDGLIEIVSPTIGTYYAAPTPEDPPFVTVGSKVDAESIVCLVEAMKVFNQIPAGVSGTIAKILVDNGDPVEFDTPLFKVRPG